MRSKGLRGEHCCSSQRVESCYPDRHSCLQWIQPWQLLSPMSLAPPRVSRRPIRIRLLLLCRLLLLLLPPVLKSPIATCCWYQHMRSSPLPLQVFVRRRYVNRSPWYINGYIGEVAGNEFMRKRPIETPPPYTVDLTCAFRTASWPIHICRKNHSTCCSHSTPQYARSRRVAYRIVYVRQLWVRMWNDCRNLLHTHAQVGRQCNTCI